MAPTDQPGTTILGRPKPAQQRPPPRAASPPIGGIGASPPRPTGVTTTSIAAGIIPRRTSPQFEFRGFDFFANRDFNELKNASRAYFAPATAGEKHQRLPSTWLGDATPPTSPRPSTTFDPPPVRENRFLGGPIGGGQVPSNERKIFGLRRRQFWWLLALVALLLVVAIGVGVGVGVGRSASNSSKQVAGGAVTSSPSSSSSGTVSSSDSPAATGTVTTTSNPSKTTTSSTSTPTGDTEGKIDCPAANGTTYQVPGSDKRFLRICGIDYSSDQAVDIRQVPTESILDCMKNCAGTAGCTGCGWGYLQGDTGTQHKCWLKGNLKKSHEADINWAFAVLL
ncbi:uncharacterized protein F4822DRAFT_51508 [Hypoxylon trugodes]|uniref:uncharacterized protein n=1 Tax=Hypoxylon trugodes TaxID=326681 RepID=UPI00219AE7F9|nr:uncharacterized protein F4822DRAFT_51508 [Hypoxylon trugodes]KAI1383790.1 hypothetical protein F4822DRAFT_51508 [Hypoxylon trugodes]